MKRLAAAVAGLVMLVVLAACGSPGDGSTGRTSHPAAVGSASAAASGHGLVRCPSPAAAPAPSWPSQLPADLPKPSPATILHAVDRAGGLREAQFVVPRSLRDEVLFVLQKLPPAGYIIGRGDSELREADAPFVHGEIHGLIRLSALSPCRTEWTVVTVAASASPTAPLLPPHSTSSGTPMAPTQSTAPFATSQP